MVDQEKFNIFRIYIYIFIYIYGKWIKLIQRVITRCDLRTEAKVFAWIENSGSRERVNIYIYIYIYIYIRKNSFAYTDDDNSAT